MEDESLKWSPAYPLFNSKCHLAVKGKLGVYRIRAFTEYGEPLPICRLGGVDRLGILHIGKSVKLGDRIQMFRRAAEGLKAAHHAGREFYEWRFERLIPHERLHFDYFDTSTGREALSLERALHQEYRNKFLDRPPLDGTSGQTGGKK
jgi:hypothetical protein